MNLTTEHRTFVVAVEYIAVHAFIKIKILNLDFEGCVPESG